MSKSNLPQVTQDLLHELFTYDGKHLRWRKNRARARAGAIAGELHSTGYRKVHFLGHRHYAHRLIWMYVHGEWPQRCIDHINRDKGDNRIENLRDVPHGVNMRNIVGYGRSGVLGVEQIQDGVFHAKITIGKERVHLGAYNTIEEAAAARRGAERVRDRLT